MRKVLIIANLFHASPRIPGLAKYLPEFGWETVILTPPLGERPEEQLGPSKAFIKNNRVVETAGPGPNHDIRTSTRKRLAPKRYFRYVKPFLKFLYRIYSEIINYPDSEKTWTLPAIKAAQTLLHNERISAVISSSSPATAHLIACELKRKFNVVWVADFRDLWTQNHNYPFTPMRKMFERRFEIRTMSTADALVTAASIATEKMQSVHPAKSVYTITNGFDPERMNNGKTRLTKKFTITYTGQVYPGRQDPSKLIIAIEELIEQKSIDPKDFEVRFYGPENSSLATSITEHSLSEIVRQYGIIPREDALARQRESQALLLLNWEDAKVKEVYTGKIFEYLAAMRPVLATGGFGHDVVETLLRETSSGQYCPTIEEIKNRIKESYAEYKQRGEVSYYGKKSEIDKYSYREMARKFAEILERHTVHQLPTESVRGGPT